MRWAAVTPAKAPVNCARIYAGVSRQAIPPSRASDSVTAGFRCAPEMGPNARMMAKRAAPVTSMSAGVKKDHVTPRQLRQ